MKRRASAPCTTIGPSFFPLSPLHHLVSSSHATGNASQGPAKPGSLLLANTEQRGLLYILLNMAATKEEEMPGLPSDLLELHPSSSLPKLHAAVCSGFSPIFSSHCRVLTTSLTQNK